MNDMSPIEPYLVEVTNVGNRQALLLPEGFSLPAAERWVVQHHLRGMRLVPYVEADWIWAEGLAGLMDEDWAQAIEAGRIGPDHPDNALDEEPVFD